MFTLSSWDDTFLIGMHEEQHPSCYFLCHVFILFRVPTWGKIIKWWSVGLSFNSCRSQLLQPYFGRPGGECFPWGSSRECGVEPQGELRSTTAPALCWAICCVGITISGKLLLKWMSSSITLVTLWRDGANFSKACHLLCLGDSSSLLSTTWYNSVTIESAQPGRNEGL